MANTIPSNSERIDSIDILRGFTLFGIILVHFVEQYYAGPWPKEYDSAINPTIADQIVGGFVGIFITGKFFMIFSLLFGMSFYIQLSKNDGDKRFLIRFLWRLVLLFAIGFLHHLHYRGDILTIYAVLGLGLLILHRLPDMWLLVLSLLLVFNVPSFLTRAVQIYYPPSSNIFEQDQEVLLVYFNTVKSGSYLDILQKNFFEFAGKMEFQVVSGRIYITLGLFLLGVYAGRKKFFEGLNSKIKPLKRLRFYAWLTILAAFVIAGAFFGGMALLNVSLPNAANFMVGGLLFDAFNTALATIYVTWILLLLQKEKWQARLNYLYPVGRMGLTVYLMQTVLGTLVFFSYGLGLIGSLTSWMTFVIAIGLFGLQVIVAKWWFKHFTYGPIEWMWRNATYWRIFPLVKTPPKVSEAMTNV